MVLDLPSLLQPRQDNTPASIGDALTYLMISDAIKVSSVWTPISNEDLSSWLGLASAKNPVYRLIAMEVFNQFEATPEQAERFYSSYLQENELAINQLLADTLAQRRDQWAKNLTPQIKAKIQN